MHSVLILRYHIKQSEQNIYTERECAVLVLQMENAINETIDKMTPIDGAVSLSESKNGKYWKEKVD